MGDHLLDLASHFPSMHKHIRWHAVKLAIHRYLLREGRKLKRKWNSSSNIIAMLRRSSDADSEMAAAAAQAHNDHSNPSPSRLRDKRVDEPRPSGRGSSALRTSSGVAPAVRRPSVSHEAKLARELAVQGAAISDLRTQQQQLCSDVAEIRALLLQAMQGEHGKGRTVPPLPKLSPLAQPPG